MARQVRSRRLAVSRTRQAMGDGPPARMPLLGVSPEQGPWYQADLIGVDAIATVGKVDLAGRAVDVDVQIPAARFGS